MSLKTSLAKSISTSICFKDEIANNLTKTPFIFRISFLMVDAINSVIL